MIEQFTRELVEKFVAELNRDDNRKRLEREFIDPTVRYILDRCYPYIFATSAAFIILLLIVITILFMLVRKS